MNEIHCGIAFPFLGPNEDYDFPLDELDLGYLIDREIDEEDLYLELRYSLYPRLDQEGEDFLAEVIRRNEPANMTLYMIVHNYVINWKSFEARYPKEVSTYRSWSDWDMLP